MYREVEEYLEGEHYVTYHEVDLDEEKSLQLVCALHFERLGTDLPSGSEFYYANWWFAKDGSPVPDGEALPLIGYTSLNEVKLILDVRYYRALHERGMQNSGVRTWVLHFCRRRFSSCFSHLFSFFAMNSLLADQLWP